LIGIHRDFHRGVRQYLGDAQVDEERALIRGEYHRPAMVTQGLFQRLEAEPGIHRSRQPRRQSPTRKELFNLSRE
jgi:hypothetical protein